MRSKLASITLMSLNTSPTVTLFCTLVLLILTPSAFACCGLSRSHCSLSAILRALNAATLVLGGISVLFTIASNSSTRSGFLCSGTAQPFLSACVTGPTCGASVCEAGSTRSGLSAPSTVVGRSPLSCRSSLTFWYSSRLRCLVLRLFLPLPSDSGMASPYH